MVISNNNLREIIENYIAAYNNFNSDGMLRDLHDEIVFENIANGQVNLQTRGKDEFSTQAETAKKLFKQREQKVLDIQFDDKTAKVHIDFTGILSDDPANGPQAGASINMTGDSVFVFEEGKIIRITDRS